MTSTRGFNLIELIVAIAIFSILASITLPNISAFITAMRVDNEIHQLQRLLLMTRHSAVSKSETVTLCPLNQENQCHNAWKSNLSIFIDNDNNGIYEPNKNEELLYVKTANTTDDTLSFSYTRVSYQPTGILNGIFNGTFRYCPKKHEELSRGIIISSTSGRIYTTLDTNNDGRDNNRSGKNIACL